MNTVSRLLGGRRKVAIQLYGGFCGERQVIGFLWILTFALIFATGLILFTASNASAELCWFYVDTENTAAPFRCVRQDDLTTPCSWDPSCHLDGDPGDCCTTVPAPPGTTQSLLNMHTDWHNCFGNVGVANNPPGRGQRWYAFHRQFEHDFNIWREDGHLCNPSSTSTSGCKIESIEWCPNVIMPYGHFGTTTAPGVPASCGAGPGEIARPNNIPCNNCIAFPQCLFVSGGGPTACPTAPSSSCSAPGGVTYPYTSLAQFQNVEEVATILDNYFHGQMHGAVGAADTPTTGNNYIDDVVNPVCSPRDPMFWRLHKALDDVVRAWQNINSTDVMVVIDRSGSMSEMDSAGTTKMNEALEAADMFADLLEEGRSDGKQNRIGIVSFSTGAADAALNMPLTVADATLRNPGGPLKTVLNNIRPFGWTSIGSGLEAALRTLCPPNGDCNSYIPPAGENSRKSILLLTDGVENVPACLRSAGPATTPVVPPPFPFDQCFGAQLDRDTTAKIGRTQVCAVGFGDAGSLNGDLLTLFAERQGGIYMQNPPADPDGEWIDLKDFFAKCFGQLTDEFIGLDPKGILPAKELVSEPIEYTSCDDEKITFSSGWKDPEDLRLIVTSPSGTLVLPGDPNVEASKEPTWHFNRIQLPYRGESAGTWRAHLIRPHWQYVNGFTTDSFLDMDEGVALVRRQIQRLCPDGCDTVLYFEDGRIGPRSAYEEALEVERNAGVLNSVVQAADATDFDQKLSSPWDLIVYAHQLGNDAPEPYDIRFAGLLCQNQHAIVTDTRLEAANGILECASVRWDGTVNWSEIIGDRQLVDGTILISNTGYLTATYGLAPFNADVQATNEQGGGAIVASRRFGEFGPGDQKWFVNVLVRGLSRLDQHKPVSFIKAGEGLLPTVQILPSFNPSGGYDNVNVRVEIERPLVGVGTVLGQETLHDPRDVPGEIISPRDATLSDLRIEKGGPFIPTEILTFTLYDDGTHGDLHAGNGTWSTQLPDLALRDGMYLYRFIFEGTNGMCTTHRELTHSVFVEVEVDPRSSDVTVGPPDPTTGISLVDILPRDHLGNLWGPGRAGTPACSPTSACNCNSEDVIDHGDGRYTIPVTLSSPDAICLIDAFGTRFVLNQEPAATLDLAPETATNPVGTDHTVTATVRDAQGQPLSGQAVEFRISGANNSPHGSATTNAQGEAIFTYTGVAEGVDTITAWVDENQNAHQDAGEPSDVTTKIWIPITAVDIDIRPHRDHNIINLARRDGLVPVAILSTVDFDAPREVDRSSLTFGRSGDEESLTSCHRRGEDDDDDDGRGQDINDDGLADLICYFRIRLTGFQIGDTEGILRGQTINGTFIEGRDSVVIVWERTHDDD